MRRYREIARLLTKHGFGFAVDQLGLGGLLAYPSRLLRRRTADAPPISRGERVRRLIEELGPTFIKLGQLMSTRPDLIPSDVVAELERLQDRVPPFPFDQVRGVVEHALGRPLEAIYADFDPAPLAAASIGQVHRATLFSGERVVVKVQRPGITRLVDSDLEVLRGIALAAERRTRWGKMYGVAELADEFSRSLRAELDYRAEARNAERIRRQFQGDRTVRIPRVHADLTTDKILTLQFVEGVKLNELDEIERRGWDRRKIARRVARAVFRQVLIHGFFHADPHPGNVAVVDGERIAFMDFGMVGRMTVDMQEHFAALAIGLMRRDSGAIVRAVLKMGVVPADVDIPSLKREVDDLREQYLEVPLSQISLGQALRDMLDLTFRYRIRMPRDLALLAKALITAEGTVTRLDPNLSVMEVAAPFGKKLLAERTSPGQVATRFLRDAAEYGELLADLPGHAKDFLRLARDGRLQVRLELEEPRWLLERLDKATNRLSASILFLALSIVLGMVAVASALTRAGAGWTRFPAAELGAATAAVVLIWLLMGIYRSGRL